MECHKSALPPQPNWTLSIHRGECDHHTCISCTLLQIVLHMQSYIHLQTAIHVLHTAMFHIGLIFHALILLLAILHMAVVCIAKFLATMLCRVLSGGGGETRVCFSPKKTCFPPKIIWQ